jgi:hypothetical protein
MSEKNKVFRADLIAKNGSFTGLLILFIFILVLYGNKITMINQTLSFSSINCNSLNSSVSSKGNRNLKVNGITKLGTDIIFCCDTRLSNKNLVSCENEIKKAFELNFYDGYECFFNSSKNKRGVGILFNKNFIHSCRSVSGPGGEYLASEDYC